MPDWVGPGAVAVLLVLVAESLVVVADNALLVDATPTQ